MKRMEIEVLPKEYTSGDGQCYRKGEELFKEEKRTLCMKNECASRQKSHTGRIEDAFEVM